MTLIQKIHFNELVNIKTYLFFITLNEDMNLFSFYVPFIEFLLNITRLLEFFQDLLVIILILKF